MIRSRLPFAAKLGPALVAGMALVTGLALAACSETTTPAEGPEPAPVPASAQSGPGADDATTMDRAVLVAAYDRGLDFLAKVQKDGTWGGPDGPHVGLTAIAVTTMLERPGGVRKSDRPIVDAAVKFLAQTLVKDGSVGGSIRANYETSVVVMALAAEGQPEHAPLIERAAGFLKRIQRLETENPTYGGIGYGSDNTRSDLSNTQYALASLRAAGIPEDDPVFQRALTFLSRVQNWKENEGPNEPSAWTDADGNKVVRSNDGGANYYPGNSKAGVDERPDGVGVLRSYGSMTYALLRCYHFAGLDRTDARVAAVVDWVQKNWVLDRNPGMPEDQRLQGLFYYYATAGRTLKLTGLDALEVPERGTVDWRADLAKALLSRQGEDGSWINHGADRWMEGNPLLATSYALNALQACVR